MAHFAIVAPPLRGHLDPAAALGRELIRRGHRATLVSDAEGFDASGLDVVRPGAGALAAQNRQLGVLATVRAMAARFDALCDTLPALFARLGVDAVIADQTEPGGALAARRAGLPYASLAAALPLNTEPDLPPPFVDWRYRQDRRWLYEGGHRVAGWLMAPLSRAIARRARLWGIDGVATLEDTFSPRLQLLQIPRGLDFPRRALPAPAHHVGPLRDPEVAPFDLPDDGRPLAFCSLGTLQGFRADLFEAFARALASQGLRPVIAHGGRLPASAIAALPGDPIVADFLPQRAILPRCRLAIVNGGLNTVLDALAAGVPLIVTPIAYEQGAIAARVESSGAGLAVRPRQVPRSLGDACGRVLKEPRFRAAARRLGEESAAAGGVAAAAALVEAMAAGRSH